MAKNKWVTRVFSPYLQGPHNSIYSTMEINLPGPCTSILWQLVGLQSRDTWRNYANQQSVKTPVLEIQGYKVEKGEHQVIQSYLLIPQLEVTIRQLFRVTWTHHPKKGSQTRRIARVRWEFPTSKNVMFVGWMFFWGSGDRDSKHGNP